MPVIRVFDRRQPYAAVAVMAVAFSKKSETLDASSGASERSKVERTRPKNPNGLTVNQHVFPLKSMEQFALGGRISTQLLAHGEVKRLKPKNALFCASRAWDQRAESGYMKQIEDQFQATITPILARQIGEIQPEQKPAVDRMFALWFLRSRFRKLESQEIELKGVPGDNLTKEQEENLEKNGYSFARAGGKIPARQINGIQLQMRIDQQTSVLASDVGRWGIIIASSGEFIVPDVPLRMLLPLTPTMALVGSAPDGMITEKNLAEINRSTKTESRDYFFARDLSKCPF